MSELSPEFRQSLETQIEQARLAEDRLAREQKEAFTAEQEALKAVQDRWERLAGDASAIAALSLRRNVRLTSYILHHERIRWGRTRMTEFARGWELLDPTPGSPPPKYSDETDGSCEGLTLTTFGELMRTAYYMPGSKAEVIYLGTSVATDGPSENHTRASLNAQNKQLDQFNHLLLRFVGQEGLA